jgi:tetratricopeptide (TPR) repeat protein
MRSTTRVRSKNFFVACCTALSLITLASANCWVIEHPLPIYKTFSGSAKTWSSIPYFDRVIESDPKNWINYYERGKAYDQIGCLQLALADYDQALKFRPADLDIIEQRSNLLYKIGDYKRSLADRNWLMSERAATSYDYARRAQLLEQLGKKELVLADARQAINLSPNLADGHLVLAYALLSLENTTDATSQCQIANDLLPLKRRFLTELCTAQILIAEKQWVKSIEHCNKALSKNCYAATALWLRALDYYYLRNYNQAVTDATDSICYNPMLAAPYLVRAEAYYKLGRKHEGDRDRKTALELDLHLDNIADICYRVFP